MFLNCSQLYFYSCIVQAQKFVANYNFKEFVINTIASNCLTVGIKNYQKEIWRKHFVIRVKLSLTELLVIKYYTGRYCKSQFKMKMNKEIISNGINIIYWSFRAELIDCMSSILSFIFIYFIINLLWRLLVALVI